MNKYRIITIVGGFIVGWSVGSIMTNTMPLVVSIILLVTGADIMREGLRGGVR